MRSFRAKNARRIELIGRKYAGGLSADETAELGQLKQEVDEYMARKFPRDSESLDEIDAKFAAIKARIEAKRMAGQS